MPRVATKNSKTVVELSDENIIYGILSGAPGATNEDIFNIMAKNDKHIHCIEDDKERSQTARRYGLAEVPGYDSLKAQRLREHIRNVRHKYDKHVTTIDDISAIIPETKVMSLDEIKDSQVNRISTGIEYIDDMYGYSSDLDEWGMPRGALTLCAGSPGVGKSKLAIKIAGEMSNKEKLNHKVLYIQNEAAPEQFKQWTRGVIEPDANFLLSESCRLNEQLATMKEHKPDVVIVDSIQMIMEAGNHSGLISTVQQYKIVAMELDCHVMFISQLNKSGDVAGTQKLPHLVDIVFKVVKGALPGQFFLECPEKNRYGATNKKILFQHQDGNVVCLENEAPHKNTFGQNTKMGSYRPAKRNPLVNLDNKDND